jgi:hypothetical protein
MAMEMLRTKTPEIVRKEIGMHLLAYNLIRGVMAEAARGREVQPLGLSFNGARQTMRAFEETHLSEPNQIAADFPILLNLIDQKRVGDRPDRNEPRAVKRRPKPFRLLTIPRREAKRTDRAGRDNICSHKITTRRTSRKFMRAEGFGYPGAIQV